ncbi:MAG TPA: ATP-binding protein [Amaricoccus sp.]|uniref:hybrid sensor histidine kinase/response regulator n=3 Tax=Amaricoccus TaxID=56999 RepID=UPI002BE00DF3|nr:ATP-binding protein [Amaricoccus sp.]HRO11971.1 ATP-binding protein [Amaricoccus sp.]
MRTGAGLAAAGALLLASTATELWSGSAIIPAALAASLLVCGGYLLSLRAGLLALPPARGAAIRSFDGHPEPVLLTGRVRGANAAARRARLDAGIATGAACYRLTREARLNGVAAEEIEPRGRLVVTRAGPRSLLWRLERGQPAGSAEGAGFETSAFPWFRIDAEGRILQRNAAAAALIEGRQRFDEILADAPLRPDGVHLLAATGQAVRAITLAAGDDRRELLLLPLQGAEISGLVPDHFLEDLPVALARLEAAGRLTYANKAARQLLGDRAQPGVDIAELLEGLGRPIAERLADTVRGRALGRSEIARLTGDGPEVFLQVAFTRAVLDGATSLLAVISDATELKTLEAQFVQSQKMQAVGQLAGGVAHDFNNLLTAINGHCDLLLMRHDVADVEHGDLMQIRQNANRAAALVRQLLAFSRKQTLRPTVINLQDTLSELTHLLNRLLSDKVTLRIEHAPDLAPVRVDERQIEQVIMNLVVNARDAMPRGGEVRITTRNVRLGHDLHRDRAVILRGDYVIIEVADSGHGIPEGKLNKIFEPFFTTKQVGEGTGLGLSTAYGIVKQTGGFIFADSPPGRGAIFTIYLPAYDKGGPVAPAEEEPEVRRPRDLTGRGLVLLVEDEDPVRSFAARALRLRGYTVVEAASGEEALEILEDPALHVDIMLSDVIMPGLDGPAWVREAQKARPDAKVIFMSGYAEDAFSGGDSGVRGANFLQKPFTLNELTERVKDQLQA